MCRLQFSATCLMQLGHFELHEGGRDALHVIFLFNIGLKTRPPSFILLGVYRYLKKRRRGEYL